MRIRLFVLALASCAAFASVGNAETPYRPHRHHHHHVATAAGNEVVVHKRSFLDAGVIVPVGSQNFYFAETKIYNSMSGINNQSYFTEDLLPGPLGQPAGMPGFQN
jgi:hypothetical protein